MSTKPKTPVGDLPAKVSTAVAFAHTYAGALRRHAAGGSIKGVIPKQDARLAANTLQLLAEIIQEKFAEEPVVDDGRKVG